MIPLNLHVHQAKGECGILKNSIKPSLNIFNTFSRNILKLRAYAINKYNSVKSVLLFIKILICSPAPSSDRI